MRPTSKAFLLSFYAGLAFSRSVQAQTNIVNNGSFEEIDAGWTHNNGLGVYPDAGAPDGRVFVFVEDAVWQDLETVLGRDYVISFAARGTNAVTWGDTLAGPLTNLLSAGLGWTYRYCYVTAQTNVTRLRFGRGFIDDVKVGWLQEPIRFVAQPESRTALEGGTVSFFADVEGTPPLQYQWFFKGQPVFGGTNRALTITPVYSHQQGGYSVMASNAWNTIQSDVAQLQVAPPPTSPEIVSQPVGDLCPIGYGCRLQVFAVGAPPLRYQWSLNGTDLAGATNSSLSFPAVQSAQAGIYRVLVSNDLGTVLSLPAELSVTTLIGGGRIFIHTPTNNAPIYDVDGIARLGTNFLAQVYAAATPGILRPLGAAIRLQGGHLFSISRQVPDVAPNQTVFVQLRAWEAAYGASYEQARAGGGKYGFSPISQGVAGSSIQLVRTESFRLRAGELFFVAGLLKADDRLPDGTRQYILMGESGARYLIETRQPPNNWLPMLIFTNDTGTTVFTDPEPPDRPVRFYRARLLD